MRMLARDGVHAFYAATFGGFDLQTHFLAERSRKEAAHGVGLPAGGFHQFGQGRALGLFQEGDDMGALAALAPRSGLGLGPAFRRFLAPTGGSGRLGIYGSEAANNCRDQTTSQEPAVFAHFDVFVVN